VRLTGNVDCSGVCLLQLQRNAHVVRGQVLDVDQVRQLAREGDVGDALDEGRFVERVRNAGDVDGLAAARFRAFLPGRADTDGAGAVLVDVAELVGGIDDLPARGEIGALDVAAKLRRRHLEVGVDHLDQAGADLGQVVRRDVGRHADGNAGGAVDQHVGNARREDHRFLARAVVVRPEHDGVLIDLRQHLVADPRQTALGVAHRRGVVAIERSEVARSVDERIAQRERLRHADERLVQRRVAVGMVVAHHVANDLRALAMLRVGRQVLLPHRVEDAALDGFHPVAHVRQRARSDHGERVVQIAFFRRFVQRDAILAAGWRARHDVGVGLDVEQRRRLGRLLLGHGTILVRQVRQVRGVRRVQGTR
jgi:hypothetical protein